MHVVNQNLCWISGQQMPRAIKILIPIDPWNPEILLKSYDDGIVRDSSVNSSGGESGDGGQDEGNSGSMNFICSAGMEKSSCRSVCTINSCEDLSNPKPLEFYSTRCSPGCIQRLKYGRSRMKKDGPLIEITSDLYFFTLKLTTPRTSISRTHWIFQ